jgi:hypothetical protein
VETLNLIDLAKAAGGGLRPVPGTGFEVQALLTPRGETLERELWLLVLQGELLIDLPHGDFRHLRRGDSLRLEAGLKVTLKITLTPLGETVLLRG